RERKEGRPGYGRPFHGCSSANRHPAGEELAAVCAAAPGDAEHVAVRAVVDRNDDERHTLAADEADAAQCRVVAAEAHRQPQRSELQVPAVVEVRDLVSRTLPQVE